MDFSSAIRTCLKEKYFDFKERASHSEYWFFLLFAAIASVAIVLFAGIFYLLHADTLGMIIFILGILALIIPTSAVTARRLHDTNHSGWWQLAPFIPSIFAVAASLVFGMDISETFIILTGYAAFMIVIFFIIQEGTDGENRFGSPSIMGRGITMDFDTAIRICFFGKYATFRGRASRSEYWFFILFSSLFGLTLVTLLTLLGVSDGGIDSLTTLFSLPFFIPQLAATARRLHDLDYSGWWQIVPMVVPSLLAFIAIDSYDFGTGLFFIVIAAIFGIIFTFYLIKEGTNGENRFDIPLEERNPEEPSGEQ